MDNAERLVEHVLESDGESPKEFLRRAQKRSYYRFCVGDEPISVCFSIRARSRIEAVARANEFWMHVFTDKSYELGRNWSPEGYNAESVIHWGRFKFADDDITDIVEAPDDQQG